MAAVQLHFGSEIAIAPKTAHVYALYILKKVRCNICGTCAASHWQLFTLQLPKPFQKTAM